MPDLFDRVARVTILNPRDNDFFGVGRNAIVIEDLRVRFSIEKSLGSDPNAAEIIIDNLAQPTRAKLQTLPLQVRLEVGYVDNIKIIYIGDLIWSESRREGTAWTTTLQLGTSARANRHARVNRSFGAGTTLRQVVREVVFAMGQNLPPETRDPAFDKQYVSGFALHGRASRCLTQLLEPINRTYSIQDNRLQILEKGKARNSKAYVISQDNGMIGIPEFGTPARKQKPVLHARSLLYPELYAGGRVQMDSQLIRGTFRINKVTHSGDTHGKTWETTIEGRPL